MAMLKTPTRRVMDGETVKVRVRSTATTTTTTAEQFDRFGNAVPAWAEAVDVHNVLVSKATADERQADHPEGVTVTTTLTFPRTCTLDLRGAKVIVGGRELLVVGEPAHEASPLYWDMTVQAGVHDG